MSVSTLLLRFCSFRQFIPLQDHKSLSINQYYEWFEPAIDKWLDVAKIKVTIPKQKSTH